jgi:GT2 family glycosyltransferase
MDTYNYPEIDKYLAENLPASEERIPVPMNPACEVCVVIPAYDEREYILLPLESLSRQDNVTANQYEVIVVVNNPPPLPGLPPQDRQRNQEKWERHRQVMKNNRETLELIRYIKGAVDNLDPPLSAKEAQMVRGIKDRGLKLFALDKSSAGKTLPPESANVGGARNRGVAEAVERFYKQLGKNGILAHTDADTRMEENYIHNLIQAFRANPQVVALGGVDEDILENPWDSEAMRHFLWGQAKEIYLSMLHRLFFSEPVVEFIRFIGSNMASRAYETALCGGIVKKPGAEDTQLARDMSRIGKTTIVDDVVNFPTIRYSLRTTTGKGNRMAASQAEGKKSGQLLVRSMEGAFCLAALCNQLKKAKLQQKTSRENLREILTYDNERLLDDEDLELLSQHMNQFETCRKELLNPVLSLLVEKICESVDRLHTTQPITNAVNLLLNTYFRDENLKRTFNEIYSRRIRERGAALAALENVVANVFENAALRHDLQHLEELLAVQLANRQTPLISRVFTEKRYRIRRVAELITLASTKAEALELIKINYMGSLFLPGDEPVLSVMFNLETLNEIFKKQAETGN